MIKLSLVEMSILDINNSIGTIVKIIISDINIISVF